MSSGTAFGCRLLPGARWHRRIRHRCHVEDPSLSSLSIAARQPASSGAGAPWGPTGSPVRQAGLRKPQAARYLFAANRGGMGPPYPGGYREPYEDIVVGAKSSSQLPSC